MSIKLLFRHCIALHCVASQCIALHCIALHCIADTKAKGGYWQAEVCIVAYSAVGVRKKELSTSSSVMTAASLSRGIPQLLLYSQQSACHKNNQHAAKGVQAMQQSAPERGSDLPKAPAMSSAPT